VGLVCCRVLACVVVPGLDTWRFDNKSPYYDADQVDLKLRHLEYVALHQGFSRYLVDMEARLTGVGCVRAGTWFASRTWQR